MLGKVSSVVTAEAKAGLNDPTLAVPEFHIPHQVRENLAVLREVISMHNEVRFHYKRTDENKRTRTARPLGMFYWGAVGHLRTGVSIVRVLETFVFSE